MIRALWRQWWRDWRLAEQRLLLLALVTAVMAVTSVGFFTDRITHAMQQQASSLLGADLQVVSTRPLPQTYRQQAQRQGLQTASVIEMSSMVLSRDAAAAVLVQVKAVSQGYPLRGSLQITTALQTPSSTARSAPHSGEVWVELRLLQRLGLQIGESLQLGYRSFKISRLITLESDRGSDAFQLAPRVMMNLDDLETTGLLTPASRAKFRLLIAGPAHAVNAFRHTLEPQLRSYERLQQAAEGRPELTSAIQRASRFMGLAAVLAVVLGGAAVALAAHGFNLRESSTVAILRALGARRRQLLGRYLSHFSLLILLATLFGSLLGFLAQFALAFILRDWLQTELPAPRLWPLLGGLGTAALTLLGFALPPVLQLVSTPPMRVLHKAVRRPPLRTGLTVFSLLLASYLLIRIQAGEWLLATWLFTGLTLALGCLYLLTWSLASALRHLPMRAVRPWQQGIKNIARFKRRSALLMTTFGMGFVALMLLTSVRGDLLGAWQKSLPADAPNHFLINIQPAELPALRTFLHQRGLDTYQLFPMVRGRLVAKNQQTIQAQNFASTRARRLLNREFFLSSIAELPKANRVIEGQWFDTQTGGFSVESGIADTLGLKLGDRLRFDIGGQILEAPITSLREVQWDSLQPNFFVIAAPSLLEHMPTSYITSIAVAAQDTQFTAALVSQFPGMTVLDLRAILGQVERIIGQASRAVEFVFLFTLIAATVVLLAALQTQRNERRREIAILKTLGASAQQIRISIITEFGVLGLLAGALGGSLAMLIGIVVAWQVFHLPYQPAFSQLLLLAGGAALLLGGIGSLAVNQLLKTSPTTLLREAS